MAVIQLSVLFSIYLQNKVVCQMKKKYDKVDLTGNNFKARKTPQKQMTVTVRSPLTNSPAYQSKQSTEKIDPNNLFQKVCCPNCRYIFKIIKNTEILFPQASPKKSITHHVSIQTDEIVARELKTFEKMSYQLSKMDNSESSIFKIGMIKHNKVSKSQIIKEPEHLKESTYQFPDHSPIKNKNVRRLSNANSDHRFESSFFETSKKGMKTVEKKETAPSSQNIENLFYEQYEKAWRQVQQEVKRDLYDLPDLLSSELNNSKTIDHLVSFYTDLPSSIELPSYCKMLIRDYQIEKTKPQKDYELP